MTTTELMDPPTISQKTTGKEEPTNMLLTSNRIIWRSAPGLTFTEATDLLDWLETRGIHHKEVRMEDDGLCTVLWRD